MQNNEFIFFITLLMMTIIFSVGIRIGMSMEKHKHKDDK